MYGHRRQEVVKLKTLATAICTRRSPDWLSGARRSSGIRDSSGEHWGPRETLNAAWALLLVMPVDRLRVRHGVVARARTMLITSTCRPAG